MSHYVARKSRRPEMRQNEALTILCSAVSKKVKHDPHVLVDKLWEIFTGNNSVLAARLLIHLLEISQQPAPKPDTSGFLGLLSRLAPARQPEPQPEPTTAPEATPASNQVEPAISQHPQRTCRTHIHPGPQVTFTQPATTTQTPPDHPQNPGAPGLPLLETWKTTKASSPTNPLTC